LHTKTGYKCVIYFSRGSINSTSLWNYNNSAEHEAKCKTHDGRQVCEHPQT